MSTHLEKTTPEAYQALLDKYDTWMFDCDGVIWNGDRLVEGVVDVLRMLREKSESMRHIRRLFADPFRKRRQLSS